MRKTRCYGDGQPPSQNQVDFSVRFSLSVKLETSLKPWLSKWKKEILYIIAKLPLFRRVKKG